MGYRIYDLKGVSPDSHDRRLFYDAAQLDGVKIEDLFEGCEVIIGVNTDIPLFQVQGEPENIDAGVVELEKRLGFSLAIVDEGEIKGKKS